MTLSESITPSESGNVLSDNDLKSLVRQKYGTLAQAEQTNSCGCGCDSGGKIPTASIMNEDYTQLAGYVPEADLALGCGVPTTSAAIVEGNTVLDLGSGAGNDAFVARQLVGQTGKVIGVDFTEEMIEKARSNAQKLGFTNVEFRLGDIEAMPTSDNEADVIVSNCVLNLVPHKHAAFAEVFRTLKHGGHFSISDIVVTDILPNSIQQVAELYAGCVAGAITQHDYLEIIRTTGFVNVRVVKERVIVLPNELLQQHLSADEFVLFRASGVSIVSITVYGEKP